MMRCTVKTLHKFFNFFWESSEKRTPILILSFKCKFKMKVFLFLLTLGVLLSALHYFQRQSTEEKRKTSKDLIHEHVLSQDPGSIQHIFVVIPVYCWNDIIPTLDSLFENAYMPQRIHVGLIINPETQCQEVAEKQLTKYDFVTRVFVHDKHYNLGPQAVRKLCVERLYNNERFIFFTHSHMRFSRFWDALLEISLSSGYSQGFHLVTQVPLEVSKDWLPPPSAVSTFPVLSPEATIRRGLPVFSGRAFKESEVVYESPSLSLKCLFGESDFILNKMRLLDTPVPLTTSSEDDFITSALGFCAGARFCNPMQSIGYHVRDKSRPTSNRDFFSKQMHKYKKNVLRALKGDEAYSGTGSEAILEKIKLQTGLYSSYIDHLGVIIKSGSIPGHLILGVSNNSSEREIIHKFGSKRKFDTFRRHFCID